MAETHLHSPYTVPGQGELEYPTGDSVAFAVPGLEEENGWVDLPGLGYASPHRIEIPTDEASILDFRPEPNRPPEEFWNRQNDIPERHGVEFQDTDGFEVAREGSGKPRSVHPESIRPIPPRLTDKLSPHTYTFTRPFDQHAERQFNGEHFSMADHRRTYEVVGMAPVRAGRNTYRIMPTPWDQDIVDVPPDREPDTVQARIRQIELPTPVNRSFRLG